jgi:hypothetical protein
VEAVRTLWELWKADEPDRDIDPVCPMVPPPEANPIDPRNP